MRLLSCFGHVPPGGQRRLAVRIVLLPVGRFSRGRLAIYRSGIVRPSCTCGGPSAPRRRRGKPRATRPGRAILTVRAPAARSMPAEVGRVVWVLKDGTVDDRQACVGCCAPGHCGVVTTRMSGAETPARPSVRVPFREATEMLTGDETHFCAHAATEPAPMPRSTSPKR